MGKKIFVSYKHKDEDVYSLKDSGIEEILNPTTVRDYVDALEEHTSDGDGIYKGEHDNEDLSKFKDSTIESKLRDKIYDSSVTVVMISLNMKEINEPEDDQWIPWEISYSLKEHTRNGRTSQTNAVLSVVLPDKNKSYEYFIQNKSCCSSGCRLLKTDRLFYIIRKNMFNAKNPSCRDCDDGSKIYSGDHSYIYTVKWENFISDINKYVEIALKRNQDIEDFNIEKQISREAGVLYG